MTPASANLSQDPSGMVAGLPGQGGTQPDARHAPPETLGQSQPDPAETATAPAGHPAPVPSAAVEAAARAAHRSQFVDPRVENVVWTGATPAYRQRWHHIGHAAVQAAAPHLATDPASQPDPGTPGIPDTWITAWLQAANRCPCPTAYAPCCVRRGLHATHRLWADHAATTLAALAAEQRNRPGHNGDQTAGVDLAAHHLQQTEPGS